jgi:hypothetical protein
MSVQNHVQKANVQTQDKKQKEGAKPKAECPLCPEKTKGTHTIETCRFLPTAIKAL